MSVDNPELETPEWILLHTGIGNCGNPFCDKENMTIDEALAAIDTYYKAQASKDMAEVIGESEVFIDIPVVGNTGKEVDRITGESYTPYMIARNNLRHEQRITAASKGYKVGGE